jgi:hypothetical protein
LIVDAAEDGGTGGRLALVFASWSAVLEIDKLESWAWRSDLVMLCLSFEEKNEEEEDFFLDLDDEAADARVVVVRGC